MISERLFSSDGVVGGGVQDGSRPMNQKFISVNLTAMPHIAFISQRFAVQNRFHVK